MTEAAAGTSNGGRRQRLASRNDSWSALGARRAGFQAAVIEDATRAIDTGGSLHKAWQAMSGAKIWRIQSSDIVV